MDNPDVVDNFKEKFDIQSRTLSWIQLAKKCGIPKTKYNQFGKPKLGPTSQLFLYVRITESFKTLTVKELKEHLKDMDRFDVLRVLDKHKVQGQVIT
jgi:hypothetical protein